MADLTQYGIPTDAGTSAVTMPKLQYRFRVTLVDFGAPGTAPTEITQNVVSVTRPSLTHDEITIDAYNSKAYLAGKHTWDPLTLTVRDDMNNAVQNHIAKQLQRQINHGTQKVNGGITGVAGSNYKFGMMIQQLDGSDATVVLETWSINGCFIQNVNYNENNYATSDVMQITMSIRFDGADVHAGDPGGVSTTGAIGGGGDLATQGAGNVTP